MARIFGVRVHFGKKRELGAKDAHKKKEKAKDLDRHQGLASQIAKFGSRRHSEHGFGS